MNQMPREDAVRFFSDLFCGQHHIPAPGHEGEHGVREWGLGWYVNAHAGAGFATYDFDKLTRFVLLCHDRCVRGEIAPAGPVRIRLMIHQRERGTGSIMSQHPTIEEAVERWRKHHPARAADPAEEVPA